MGSIVDRRHLVNVLLPNDSNDHYSSRSAASYPNGAGLRHFFPETAAASGGGVLILQSFPLNHFPAA